MPLFLFTSYTVVIFVFILFLNVVFVASTLLNGNDNWDVPSSSVCMLDCETFGCRVYTQERLSGLRKIEG